MRAGLHIGGTIIATNSGTRKWTYHQLKARFHFFPLCIKQKPGMQHRPLTNLFLLGYCTNTTVRIPARFSPLEWKKHACLITLETSSCLCTQGFVGSMFSPSHVQDLTCDYQRLCTLLALDQQGYHHLGTVKYQTWTSKGTII